MGTQTTIYMHLLNFYRTERDIEVFIDYYKTTFPTATIFPKLHMLQYHLTSWLRKWSVGLGMMGEQGAESLHKWFNRQKQTFASVADRVQQLSCIMKEHFIHVAPANISLEPPIKRRKITDPES